MIRVSTRGRYALRAMIDVAQNGADGPVLRQDIADRQEISAHYVVQLFGRLQAAGLVQSVKGPGGGYRLTRDPETITAREVVEAVEGPTALVHCVLEAPGEQPLCERIDRCATHRLWSDLSRTVAEAMQSITLRDLANRAPCTVDGRGEA